VAVSEGGDRAHKGERTVRVASTSTTTVLVGDGAYGDRLAAELDLRAIAACAGNW
jgi:hypothetical protein